jgi:hypothetical protein
MTYHGKVKDGIIVLADGVQLPEGMAAARPGRKLRNQVWFRLEDCLLPAPSAYFSISSSSTSNTSTAFGGMVPSGVPRLP